MKITLLPLDVGFCPKKLQLPIQLRQAETFEITYLDANGKEQTTAGNYTQVSTVLTAAGYWVRPYEDYQDENQ